MDTFGLFAQGAIRVKKGLQQREQQASMRNVSDMYTTAAVQLQTQEMPATASHAGKQASANGLLTIRHQHACVSHHALASILAGMSNFENDWSGPYTRPLRSQLSSWAPPCPSSCVLYAWSRATASANAGCCVNSEIMPSTSEPSSTWLYSDQLVN